MYLSTDGISALWEFDVVDKRRAILMVDRGEMVDSGSATAGTRGVDGCSMGGRIMAGVAGLNLRTWWNPYEQQLA